MGSDIWLDKASIAIKSILFYGECKNSERFIKFDVRKMTLQLEKAWAILCNSIVICRYV